MSEQFNPEGYNPHFNATPRACCPRLQHSEGAADNNQLNTNAILDALLSIDRNDALLSIDRSDALLSIDRSEASSVVVNTDDAAARPPAAPRCITPMTRIGPKLPRYFQNVPDIATRRQPERTASQPPKKGKIQARQPANYKSIPLTTVRENRKVISPQDAQSQKRVLREKLWITVANNNSKRRDFKPEYVKYNRWLNQSAANENN